MYAGSSTLAQIVENHAGAAGMTLRSNLIPGDIMAYRKVCDAQAGPMVGEVLHCAAGLDLDWDLDKEEPQEAAPTMERMQMQHVDCQRSGRI